MTNTEPTTASWVIDPPSRPILPVAGTSAAFPARRLYCVGRNYAAHAVEMGHDPEREAPFFFQKNPDNLLITDRFPYPPATSDVHHEIELLVALGSGGRNIPVARARDHVWGYATALDMTRRDLQSIAKQSGRPWESAKAFDHSAPCAPLIPATRCGHLERGAIWLEVNGERRQSGDLQQMIWKVAETIACLSQLFTLAAGDLVMTGTPAGVGPVVRGDRLHGHIDGLCDLRLQVV